MKLEAIKKKATVFMKELEQDKRNTKTWKENLRQVCSQNDLHTALPQPSLVSTFVRC